MTTLQFDNYSFTITRRVKIVIALIIAAIVAIVLYGSFNGVYNRGVELEQQLNAQYLDNQNYLSTYISGFYEQVSVANTASDKLNQVLLDAVKGRYENTSAGGGYTVNSPFFNAVVEAYPEASPTEMVKLWGQVQEYVVQGREGYRNQQSKLLDMLRTYETWRNSGLVQRNVVSILGFPSKNLTARVGDNQWHGQDAVDKMFTIVLTKDAVNAYNNGTLDPLEVPSN